jgi:hypothetical protein
MKEFVLDASFALRGCFEDESTVQTESVLTLLQNQYEMPNASEKESAGSASDGIERCCSGGRYAAGYFAPAQMRGITLATVDRSWIVQPGALELM